MKTYLLDTIDRFKRFSQSLDVKTILCSKAWYVLNEDGVTENLIFQEDGTILVSVNGSTKKYTWKFIPQNQSLNIMHSETEGTMLKPAFMDDNILVFNKIGTKECMFLIDDAFSNQQKVSSLDSVKKYLLDFEKKALQEQNSNEIKEKEEKEKLRLKKLLQEEERKKNKLKELEFQLVELEKKRIEAINFQQAHENDINMYYLSRGWKDEVQIQNGYVLFAIYGFISIAGIIFLGGYKLHTSPNIWWLILMFSSVILGPLCGFLLAGITAITYEFSMIKKKYREYIQGKKIKAVNFTFNYYLSLEDIAKRSNELNLSTIESQIQIINQQINEIKQ